VSGKVSPGVLDECKELGRTLAAAAGGK
jgi:hypothetical protein